MDLVSICIPCYNREKLVKGAIESCLAQTYKNIELILVDDKSKDNTLSILRKYKNHPKVRIIAHNTRQGAASAFNTAFRASKGEFIVMNGSDDYLTPRSVERRIMRFSPELDIVYGIVKNFYNFQSLEWCEANKLNKQKRDIAGHGVMFRRRVFEKYGLFHERLMLNEDLEYWYRIGMTNWGIHKRKTDLKYIKVPLSTTEICEGRTPHSCIY